MIHTRAVWKKTSWRKKHAGKPWCHFKWTLQTRARFWQRVRFSFRAERMPYAFDRIRVAEQEATCRIVKLPCRQVRWRRRHWAWWTEHSSARSRVRRSLWRWAWLRHPWFRSERWLSFPPRCRCRCFPRRRQKCFQLLKFFKKERNNKKILVVSSSFFTACLNLHSPPWWPQPALHFESGTKK